ncbi:unnamed protein product, partial [Mesorhabditis spiculigera]
MDPFSFVLAAPTNKRFVKKRRVEPEPVSDDVEPESSYHYEQLQQGSAELKELEHMLHTHLSDKSLKLTVHKADKIHNPWLSHRFSKYCKWLKGKGFPNTESWGFQQSHYTKDERAYIATEGLAVDNSINDDLGDPKNGVYLSKHVDMVSQQCFTFTTQGQPLVVDILVCKMALGKTMMVGMGSKDLDPSPSYTSNAVNQAQQDRNSRTVDRMDSCRRDMVNNCGRGKLTRYDLQPSVYEGPLQLLGLMLPISLTSPVDALWKPEILSPDLDFSTLATWKAALDDPILGEFMEKDNRGLLLRKPYISLKSGWMATYFLVRPEADGERFRSLVSALTNTRTLLLVVEGDFQVSLIPPGEISDHLGFPALTAGPHLHLILTKNRHLYSGSRLDSNVEMKGTTRYPSVIDEVDPSQPLLADMILEDHANLIDGDSGINAYVRNGRKAEKDGKAASREKPLLPPFGSEMLKSTQLSMRPPKSDAKATNEGKASEVRPAKSSSNDDAKNSKEDPRSKRPNPEVEYEPKSPTYGEIDDMAPVGDPRKVPAKPVEEVYEPKSPTYGDIDDLEPVSAMLDPRKQPPAATSVPIVDFRSILSSGGRAATKEERPASEAQAEDESPKHPPKKSHAQEPRKRLSELPMPPKAMNKEEYDPETLEFSTDLHGFDADASPAPSPRNDDLDSLNGASSPSHADEEDLRPVNQFEPLVQPQEPRPAITMHDDEPSNHANHFALANIFGMASRPQPVSDVHKKPVVSDIHNFLSQFVKTEPTSQFQQPIITEDDGDDEDDSVRSPTSCSAPQSPPPGDVGSVAVSIPLDRGDPGTQDLDLRGPFDTDGDVDLRGPLPMPPHVPPPRAIPTESQFPAFPPLNAGQEMFVKQHLMHTMSNVLGISPGVKQCIPKPGLLAKPNLPAAPQPNRPSFGYFMCPPRPASREPVPPPRIPPLHVPVPQSPDSAPGSPDEFPASPDQSIDPDNVFGEGLQASVAPKIIPIGSASPSIPSQLTPPLGGVPRMVAPPASHQFFPQPAPAPVPLLSPNLLAATNRAPPYGFGGHRPPPLLPPPGRISAPRIGDGSLGPARLPLGNTTLTIIIPDTLYFTMPVTNLSREYMEQLFRRLEFVGAQCNHGFSVHIHSTCLKSMEDRLNKLPRNDPSWAHWRGLQDIFLGYAQRPLVKVLGQHDCDRAKRSTEQVLTCMRQIRVAQQCPVTLVFMTDVSPVAEMGQRIIREGFLLETPASLMQRLS